MILSTLDIRCRDDRDVMLIQDVALLSNNLDYSWINLVLRIFCSLFVISVFIVLVDLEDIYITSWWFLTISVIWL